MLKSCFNYVTGPTLPLLFSRKIWFERSSNSWMRLVQRTQWQMLMYHSCVSMSAPCERNIFHKHSASLALAYTHPCPVLLCVSQVKLKIGKAVRDPQQGWSWSALTSLALEHYFLMLINGDI